jgi:hypothetical protein
MAQLKQVCTVVNGSQTITVIGVNVAYRIRANNIFMVANELVPYVIAADAVYDGKNTTFTLAGLYQGPSASMTNGVVATDFTVPDNLPLISQGDVGTAAIWTNTMYKIQALMTEVSPSGLVASVNDIHASLNGAQQAQAAAAASAAAALGSQNAAKTSETNAAGSASAASGSASAAATSKTNAGTSETNAAASKTAAAGSATAAANSASAASSSQGSAASSATSAANSATVAAGSANAASTSQGAASASQTAAKTSETNSKTSETNAKTSETNAKTSETNAAGSATAAANSANASAGSATASAGSATSAASSLSQVQGILATLNALQLGSKTGDPTKDNNGNALTVGSKYFNTTSQQTRVYTSTGWQDEDQTSETMAANATASASAAAGSASAAAASQVAAKTSETNSAASASAASSSQSASATSATNAKASETNSKTSETNSKTSETNAAASAASAAATAATIGNPVSKNGDDMAGQLRLAEGSVTAPGLSFVNDGTPDTGLWHISDGVFGVTNNGQETARFSQGLTQFSGDAKVSGTTYFGIGVNGYGWANADANSLYVYGNSNTYMGARGAQGALMLVAGAAERMRVTASGRILINTTNDDGVNALQVQGQVKGMSSNSALIASNGSGVGQTSIMLTRQGAGTDEKQWELLSGSDGSFSLRSVNDGYTNAQNAITVLRPAGNGLTLGSMKIMAGGGRVQVGVISDDGSSAFQVGGNGRFSGEVQTTGYGLRMVTGSYGASLRNDGTNVFLFQTASGDQYGAGNAYRPFQWSLASGAVGIDGTGASTTFGGPVIVSNSTGAAQPLAIRANAGQQRNLQFQTGNLNRWEIMTSADAESGSNAGSNFFIQAFTDAGAWLSNPLSINRASGRVGIGSGIDVTGNLTINRTNGEGDLLLGQNDGYFYGSAASAGWWSPTQGTWDYDFTQRNICVNTYPVWHSGNLAPFDVNKGGVISAATFIDMVPAVNTAHLTLRPSSGALAREGKQRFYGTFGTGTDLGTRMVASIRAGFTQTWGKEYLDFYLNSATNDSQSDANQTRMLRLAYGGRMVVGNNTVDDGATTLQVGGTILGLGGVTLTSPGARTAVITPNNFDGLSIETFNIGNTVKKPVAISPYGGNLLIGTVTDDGTNRLQVNGNQRTYGTVFAGAAGTATAWVSSDAGYGYFRTAGNATVGSESAYGFTDLIAGNKSWLRVLPSGRTLIGNTAYDDGASQLQVAGNATASGQLTANGGQINVNNTAGYAATMYSAPAGQFRFTQYLTSGKRRWEHGANSDAESGSNAGSNWYLNCFDDSGAYLSTPMVIKRSTGNVLIGTSTDDGSSLLQVNGSAKIFGQILAAEGSVTTPGYSFQNDGAPDTGFFHISDGTFGITNNGKEAARFVSGTVPRMLLGTTTDDGSSVLQVGGGISLFNGDVWMNRGASNGYFVFNGNSGTYRCVDFKTAAVMRWELGAEGGAEQGGNSGSNWYLSRFADNGAWTDCPIYIPRNTGNLLLGGGSDNGSDKVQVNGTGSFSGQHISVGRGAGEGQAWLGQNDGYFYGNAAQVGWYSGTKGQFNYNFASQQLSVNGGTVLTSNNVASYTTGRLLNVQVFTSSGTYTRTPGTNSVVVEVQAAGGGGAGSVATASGQVSVGSPGQSGGYVKTRLSSGFDGSSVIVGAAGAAGPAGGNGGNGGASSFGSVAAAAGGAGGGAGTAGPNSAAGLTSILGSITTAGNIQNAPGATPVTSWAALSLGLVMPSPPQPSMMGGMTGKGSGGGGSGNGQSASAVAGNVGYPGCVIVWEYA